MRVCGEGGAAACWVSEGFKRSRAVRRWGIFLKTERYGLYGIADFPKAEYERRLQTTKELMRERGVDGLLMTSEENVAYFSGYRSTLAGYVKEASPATLILPATGSPSLIVDVSMRGNAEAMCALDDMIFLGWDGLGKLTHRSFPTDYVKTTLRTIDSKGLTDKTIGLELDRAMRVASSLSHLEAIKKALRQATFVDAGQLIWEARMVKSSLELEHMKTSCEMTCRAFQFAFESLKEGMTERELARAVYTGMLQAGCEDTPVKMWLNLRAGWDRYAMPDSRPTDRAFKRGDTLVVDGGTYYRGYFSDMTRIACFGNPSKEQRQMFDVARQAEQVGIDNLRAGAHVSDVHASVMNFIAESGYEKHQMYEGIGHGIGLDFHEPPYLRSYPRNAGFVLKAGMVVTMEPTIYDVPVIGGILEGDIRPAGGVFFVEDVVHVTNGKPEALSSFEKDLYVV